MRTTAIKASAFQTGEFARELAREQQAKTRHQYKAAWVPHHGIQVTDADGKPVAVLYGATQDSRTCYAHVEGVGFIGGWQYPHRREPFKSLIASINRGILYGSISVLPKSHKSKTCPHCGGEL